MRQCVMPILRGLAPAILLIFQLADPVVAVVPLVEREAYPVELELRHASNMVAAGIILALEWIV